jgi:hypothetical protein
MMVRGLVEASAGSLCVANIAVPFAKLAAVVLTDVQRPLV